MILQVLRVDFEAAVALAVLPHAAAAAAAAGGGTGGGGPESSGALLITSLNMSDELRALCVRLHDSLASVTIPRYDAYSEDWVAMAGEVDAHRSIMNVLGWGLRVPQLQRAFSRSTFIYSNLFGNILYLNRLVCYTVYLWLTRVQHLLDTL